MATTVKVYTNTAPQLMPATLASLIANTRTTTTTQKITTTKNLNQHLTNEHEHVPTQIELSYIANIFTVH